MRFSMQFFLHTGHPCMVLFHKTTLIPLNIRQTLCGGFLVGKHAARPMPALISLPSPFLNTKTCGTLPKFGEFDRE